METIPNVRKPFQVAAIVPLRRKGANHTLGCGRDCIECSRYNEAVKSEEKAKQSSDNAPVIGDIAGVSEIAKRIFDEPEQPSPWKPLD
jgi:hypothetical protein